MSPPSYITHIGQRYQDIRSMDSAACLTFVQSRIPATRYPVTAITVAIPDVMECLARRISTLTTDTQPSLNILGVATTQALRSMLRDHRDTICLYRGRDILYPHHQRAERMDAQAYLTAYATRHAIQRTSVTCLSPAFQQSIDDHALSLLRYRIIIIQAIMHTLHAYAHKCMEHQRQQQSGRNAIHPPPAQASHMATAP